MILKLNRSCCCGLLELKEFDSGETVETSDEWKHVESFMMIGPHWMLWGRTKQKLHQQKESHPLEKCKRWLKERCSVKWNWQQGSIFYWSLESIHSFSLLGWLHFHFVEVAESVVVAVVVVVVVVVVVAGENGLPNPLGRKAKVAIRCWANFERKKLLLFGLFLLLDDCFLIQPLFWIYPFEMNPLPLMILCLLWSPIVWLD